MAVNEVTMNGETLISLVNDTVTEATLLSGETAHDASGAQITGKAKYINPNLIINRDFSVNQRGKTEYTGLHQYTVDMWQQYPTASIVTPVEGGGITLSYSGETAPSNGYIRVSQKFENQLTEGDIYTFQALIDGNLYTKTFTATNSYVQHKFGSNNQYVVYTALADFIVQLDITKQLQMSVDWVKLEPGAVATPFVKPDRALETLKCQRYLQFHTTNNIDPVDLRPTMRITPTVAQYDDGRYMYSAEL